MQLLYRALLRTANLQAAQQSQQQQQQKPQQHPAPQKLTAQCQFSPLKASENKRTTTERRAAREKTGDTDATIAEATAATAARHISVAAEDPHIPAASEKLALAAKQQDL
ncbi:hypothetical protein, conserved [Eimeria tenella]|uniref:Uncharacterized protein n=1 Tax=Eimeria tenella TaxID=5802 RepID=U6KQ33_EIMTE|nr:hypothetical protein, conserved [Eimeria tenella]CDJ37553.1 hypothetical protein, conserved [Eimeria tenella]|eukprot:XP_013228391.1 hypothetical protein, conserved [Eimeria tenella]